MSDQTSAHAQVSDVLLLKELHARLPVGLLVNDADTLEILHGNTPLPGFADHEVALDQLIESHNYEHQPRLPTGELAELVEEVAATGKPRHLPELRHDPPGQEPTWWSATLHRIETDRWGPVVVTLAIDLTTQVRARHFLEERERRHLALQQTIAAVPEHNLVSALQQVVDALVPALAADVATLRLLDTDAKLHFVAASGLRSAEARRLALDPITIGRLEAMIEARRHLLGPLNLDWFEVRWLEAQDKRIGILTIGGRSKRHPAENPLTLFDGAAAQLANALEKIERSPQFLRSRSLEVAGVNPDVREVAQTRSAELRPREHAILRLYGEGLRQTRSPNYSYSPRTLSGHTSETLAATLASAPEPRHSTFSRLPTPIHLCDRIARGIICCAGGEGTRARARASTCGHSSSARSLPFAGSWWPR